MTDADTIANAALLWDLVHQVQETINKDGTPRYYYDATSGPIKQLATLRRLADELDPENANYYHPNQEEERAMAYTIKIFGSPYATDGETLNTCEDLESAHYIAGNALQAGQRVDVYDQDRKTVARYELVDGQATDINP